YRLYVDEQIVNAFQKKIFSESFLPILELGIHHEQQHQELFLTDIKYILGHNPLFPATELGKFLDRKGYNTSSDPYVIIPGGTISDIGYAENGFYFDNEKPVHKTYFNPVKIYNPQVTNKEYLEFMNSGGYSQFRWWLSEGWDWVNLEKISS